MCKKTCPNKQKTLSRAQLQLLQSLLARELYNLEIDKQLQREMIADCWNRCDPSKPNSDDFTALNAHKDLLRALKRRHTNIARVQHAIKRALG